MGHTPTTSIRSLSAAKGPRAPRTRSSAAEQGAVLEARLTTSVSANARILRCLQGGCATFVISAVDGQMSARVRLEIVSTPAAVARYRLGAYTVSVDWSRKTVTAAGRSVALSPTEFRLFATLLGAEGRWIACDAIVRQVWPTASVSDAEKRLRVNVCYLRKRLSSIGATGALITGSGSYRTALQEIQPTRDVRVGRSRR